MAVPSNLIALQVLEAFGLPTARCASLSIEFLPASVVVVKAAYHPEQGQLEAMCEIVQRRRYVEEQSDGMQSL